MRTDTRAVLEIDSYQFILIYNFNGLKFFVA